MKRCMAGILMAAAAWPMGAGTARSEVAVSAASEPRDVRISLYDVGFGMVSELRRVTLVEGENEVRFHGLPPALDPTTVTPAPVNGEPGFQVRDQEFVYDLASPHRLYARYRGREVEVHTRDEIVTGRLLSSPAHGEEWGPDHPIVIATPVGETRMFFGADHIEKILFPEALQVAHLEPTFIWRVGSDREGPQDIRLSYRSDRLSWEATYEAILNEAGDRVFFGARIAMENETGGRFDDAAIQLMVTERGAVDHARRSAVTAPRAATARTALRYAYGQPEPTFEQMVAGPAPIHTYALPRRQTLKPGTTKLVQYALAPELPVSRFYVYDGVKFDRFQRHQRNDWNYGTEHHTTVGTHLKFRNTGREGLGMDLPPGLFRLYQQRADGSVEFAGEDFLRPTAAEEEGYVLLGPARGLRGERERTGYAEVTPLHEYEESFQIRLENNSEDTVEIRVVEHLYRWHEFEIVRADTEYETTGPRTIEFRPTLRPGGRRTIHYTVRYSW